MGPLTWTTIIMAALKMTNAIDVPLYIVLLPITLDATIELCMGLIVFFRDNDEF